MKGAMDERLVNKIEQINLLILDVDGVLTDGKIIIDDLGNETKHFNVRDGHGIKLLIRCGIDVYFLTGRRSKVVEHRAVELGIKGLYQGCKNKGKKLDWIIREKGLSGDEIAYIGDDIVDIPVFRKVGLSVAVVDACEDVKKVSDYVTDKKGGEGAVREVCEIILKTQGKWSDAVSRYGLK
jgi:3-deoxy-D-manno-octulosonate 8-phosphate phosphatase (KDO 8-P phosphatase)